MHFPSNALLSWALFTAPALSQLLNFGQGELPSCAQNCPSLNQAQAACVPPQAAQATQQEYEVCFCQSAYLQNPPLKSSGAGVCPSCTSANDQQQLMNWYVTLCNSGQGAGTSSATSTPAATSTASSAPAATTSSYQGVNTSEATQSWWDRHGRWIAMIIVLIVGFAIIITIGVIWKKRYNARRNRASATPLPTAGWGPNAHPHSYPGPAEKGGAQTQNSEAPTSPPPSAKNPKRGSKRLSKLVGR